MERSTSNVKENPLSIKTSSFQTVNSIEFNSPGVNSVISVDTDRASLLTPFPDIQPSSITWEKLFNALELPPSFLNCQAPPLPESSKISLDNWVDPDIFFLIPNSDSLLDYLKKHFPKDTIFNRGLPKAEENDKYPEGTGILITSQSWHALAIHTKKQILSTPPTKLDTLMRLWYCHILALSKLGLIQIARAEIQKLGDFENDPKYQFESYPDIFPGLYGTFVSFEIRILKVLLLSHLDDTKQSLNGIYLLLHETKKQTILLERNLEIQLQLIIASLLIKMKNIPSAIKVLKKIQKKYPKHPEILSAIGRLHIQIGNHDEAKKYFRLVENLIKDLKKSISNYNQQNTPISLNAKTINVKQLHEIILMNRSYISIMDNLYDLATQSLLEVLSLNPNHLVAANNLALCYLYQGQLKKAIETMENMISAGPSLACSQESFIFNLSTMYDLTSNTFLHKKKLCLDRIVKYSKDGLNVSCLKLN
ncbi:TPR-like protein [Anaeromyces robustus]|uniref:TPR-like protein n=1 Tax=Anaeromyces robustus TaxID=1754192 RepID=A0A1Y1XP53_9FUNG|nr:TPR-like protein [Anaeromyces robustus]|eukprot:ORX87511.1 TPR-like protein [Anaeromyces robustus]